MRSLLDRILPAAALLCLAPLNTAVAQGESEHVTICHQPPGNPPNTQTITVGQLEAHLAHGDTEGACSGQSTGAPRISGTDAIDRAADMIEEIGEMISEAETMADAAREEDDVQKLRCINDKLTQMNGFLRVAEEARGPMETAIGANDEQAAQHHFNLIFVAHSRSNTLHGQARQCTGESLVVTGGTSTDTEVDPDIPQIDLTDLDDMTDPGDDLAVDRIPERTVGI